MATIATVIASQAVITGAYSLTRQAIQLGLLPRFEIRHTSETLAGQIPELARMGLNVLILQVDYHFRFQTRPRLRDGSSPITELTRAS